MIIQNLTLVIYCTVKNGLLCQVQYLCDLGVLFALALWYWVLVLTTCTLLWSALMGSAYKWCWHNDMATLSDKANACVTFIEGHMVWLWNINITPLDCNPNDQLTPVVGIALVQYRLDFEYTGSMMSQCWACKLEADWTVQIVGRRAVTAKYDIVVSISPLSSSSPSQQTQNTEPMLFFMLAHRLRCRPDMKTTVFCVCWLPESVCQTLLATANWSQSGQFSLWSGGQYDTGHAMSPLSSSSLRPSVLHTARISLPDPAGNACRIWQTDSGLLTQSADPASHALLAGRSNQTARVSSSHPSGLEWSRDLSHRSRVERDWHWIQTVKAADCQTNIGQALPRQ